MSQNLVTNNPSLRGIDAGQVSQTNQRLQLTPDQQLAIARENINACRVSNGGQMSENTASLLLLMAETYTTSGKDLGSMNLTLDVLQQIRDNSNETVKVLLEDWSKFIQEQAELDKAADQAKRLEAQETARQTLSRDLAGQTLNLMRDSQGRLSGPREVIKQLRIVMQRGNAREKVSENVPLSRNEKLDLEGVNPTAIGDVGAVGDRPVVPTTSGETRRFSTSTTDERGLFVVNKGTSTSVSGYDPDSMGRARDRARES